MKRSKSYFGIFNSWDRFNDEVMNDIREGIAYANEIEPEEVSDESVHETFWEYLEDERMNLDIETGGYIFAFGKLGLWNYSPIGYKKIGTNVSDIFKCCTNGDYECEWYADRFNVRLRAAHHDGTHHLVFRYVESAEKMDEICEKIYDGKITTEKQLFRVTKSIRPFVAKIYGWG